MAMYDYFPSREELLHGVVDHLTDDLFAGSAVPSDTRHQRMGNACAWRVWRHRRRDRRDRPDLVTRADSPKDLGRVCRMWKSLTATTSPREGLECCRIRFTL